MHADGSSTPRGGEPETLRALARAYARRFAAPPVAGARAPGRVNLIGEHTDTSEGLVLPCAIDRSTFVLVGPARGPTMRGLSRELGPAGFEPAGGKAEPDWLVYARGVVGALRERGVDPPPFDLAVASDVPPGAGLSSSAALEVALVTALDAWLGLGLAAETRARIAHRAESGFVGVACGIMDMFASALGRRDHALRIDCRSGGCTRVPFPGERAGLLVAHSGVERRLSAGAYGERVAECRRAEAALAAAARSGGRAANLRDATPEQLRTLAPALEPVLLRRARHVVTENARVDAMCRALVAGDLAGAGALLRAGQASLRDDFEVSTPELDALCEIADGLPGVYGSRLTGAGFGGCTLHLVEAAAADRVMLTLAEGFARRHGRRPRIWRVRPAAGAEPVEPGA